MESLNYPGIRKTWKWAAGSPSLKVIVIAQPATDEELNIVLGEFSVSLQPAEIWKCVSQLTKSKQKNS